MEIKEIRKELEKSLSKKIDYTNKNICIYGAGNSTQLAENSFINEGIVPLFFIDNYYQDSSFLFDKPVITYKEAKEKCINCIILICSGNYKTCKQLIESTANDPIKGSEVYLYDEYIFVKHKDIVISNFDLLEDDLSKRTYANMIMSRMLACKQNYDLVKDNQYFAIPEFVQNSKNEIFVDCGSFVGDTIEQYLFNKEGVFKKIYAFEPEIKNFISLSNRVRRLNSEWAFNDDKIVIYNCGLGDKEDRKFIRQVDINGPSLGSSVSNLTNGNTKVSSMINISTIDSLLKNENVSFIKMDVESYEKKVVNGATKTIKENHPKLAICIYHNATDMYDLIQFIKELCYEYKIYVRQHEYTFAGTVIYALYEQ